MGLGIRHPYLPKSEKHQKNCSVLQSDLAWALQEGAYHFPKFLKVLKHQILTATPINWY